MSEIMSRREVGSAEDARVDLGAERTKPKWLAQQHSLPFSALSADEFEVFAYLLLLRENRQTGSRVVYYGKTADLGRDIVVCHEGRRHLVQCKRYETNVGMQLVRIELAKLVTNIHEGLIPQIDTVAFYIATDLTSPTIDYIQEPTRWREDAEKALTEHLGHAPTPDLLAFAKTWWPEITHESGLALTVRARKYQDLVSEFFSERPIVTGDISQVLNSNEEIKKKIDLVLSNQQSPQDGMYALLRRAEEMNPGLTFAASITGTGETVYTISKRAGAGEVSIGTLGFKEAPRGRLGAEKFATAMREGRAVELEEGEFTWVGAIQFPGRSGTAAIALSISPYLPRLQVPVRLEAQGGGASGAVVDFCNLIPIRAGTDEFEVELSGGALAGILRLVCRQSGNASFNIEFHLGKISAARALGTIRLLQCLQHGAELCVVSLESDAPLFKVFGPLHKLETLEGTARLLSALAKINAEFKVDIRYPDGAIGDEEVKTALFLAEAIEHGRVATRPPNELLIIDAPREMAVDLVRQLKTNPANAVLSMDGSAFEIFGVAVDPGERRLILENPMLGRIDDALFDDAAREADPDCVYRIFIRCARLVHEYGRWIRR